MEIIKKRLNVTVEHDSLLRQSRETRSCVILHWVMSLYEVMSFLIRSRSSCVSASVFHEHSPGQQGCARTRPGGQLSEQPQLVLQQRSWTSHTSTPSFYLGQRRPFIATPRWDGWPWELWKTRHEGHKLMAAKKGGSDRHDIKRCWGPC